MSMKIDDPYRNLTPERWLELIRYEHVLRAAARRWLFAALVASLRKAIESCVAPRPTPKSVRAR
jgi:hypothetical protein